MRPSLDGPKSLFDYRKYWAECFGVSPFLPTSREEMDSLGWDSCDIVIVTGDAYVDHPSFGMAVIGRVLEAQGFRVGIIAQPDWTHKKDFQRLGQPNLFFGVTAGNMDSMINRYTADLKIRSDDAYTPGGRADQRPDRAATVYAQRCREAYKGVPIVLGGIEASLRRIAHYDYWSDKVKRCVLFDAKADMLLFGNAERAIVELAHRLAAGEAITDIQDIRGTGFIRQTIPENWQEIDSSELENQGGIDPLISPYAEAAPVETPKTCAQGADLHPIEERVLRVTDRETRRRQRHSELSYIRLPSFEQVKADPVLYAHASRILHLETNPGNAKPLLQSHGDRLLWLNPPPIPLSTEELDWVFDLAYARAPHPSYGDAKIPAWEMIRFSINIMRGCFGGCSFCSITEHEGRIIQSRSEDSIAREVEAIRDKTAGFTGVISDLGGPTANMWRLNCKTKAIEESCKRLSCIYPSICVNLNTDQTPLIHLYRRVREIAGVKKVLIASGLRYDLAVKTPEYVRELVSHHVGGYLKIAPEHTERGPLSKMMKPGIETYDRFKEMFDQISKEAGKTQYLIPYFIAAHPGTRDEDMLNLALWLKRHGFRADQVQTFYPSPMANATTMYHTGKNPLRRISRQPDSSVFTAKGLRARRVHKAFLRYHDADNWPVLRDVLKKMGRSDLIGNRKDQLVPRFQPRGWQPKTAATQGKAFLTQHSGLAPKTPEAPRSSRRSRRSRRPS